MENLLVSFASLVKSNNGLFKSEKQAAFLLSRTCDGVFYSSGVTYGNRYAMEYVCDGSGVVRVYKNTQSKGRVMAWERAAQEVFQAEEADKGARRAKLQKEDAAIKAACARRARIKAIVERLETGIVRAARSGNMTKLAHLTARWAILSKAT